MQEGTFGHWQGKWLDDLQKIGLFLFLTSGPGNYHPINLTSLPIKIMECKARENIMKLLEDNGIVSREQDGVENY